VTSAHVLDNWCVVSELTSLAFAETASIRPLRSEDNFRSWIQPKGKRAGVMLINMNTREVYSLLLHQMYSLAAHRSVSTLESSVQCWCTSSAMDAGGNAINCFLLSTNLVTPPSRHQPSAVLQVLRHNGPVLCRNACTRLHSDRSLSAVGVARRCQAQRGLAGKRDMPTVYH
jgi:hypothetical protein